MWKTVPADQNYIIAAQLYDSAISDEDVEFFPCDSDGKPISLEMVLEKYPDLEDAEAVWLTVKNAIRKKVCL